MEEMGKGEKGKWEKAEKGENKNKNWKEKFEMMQTKKEIEEEKMTMAKGDAKPEIHFIGQILGGKDFETTDGLFCEMQLEVGKNWKLLSPPMFFQTQTSYSPVRGLRKA